jgi:ApbE superfamily uncharacterized protein (UPF0280 family)
MFDNRRVYRQQHHKQGLTAFEITVRETNLHIQADTDLSSPALQAVNRCRSQIESYLAQDPGFKTALSPMAVPGTAPSIIRDMARAARAAQVGPMAAVAGAVAEYTGRHLRTFSEEVVVENGGDIFIHSQTDTVLTVFAGTSPFSLTTGIQIPRQPDSFGICTSSGTFGHSQSFGKADAVMVMAQSCLLADAAATGLANLVKTSDDIAPTLEAGKQISGVQGLVIIKDTQIGLWGALRLIKI